MKKINVAYLVYSLAPGGLENVVVSLANKLDLECFNPIICCFKPNGILKERVKSGIEVIEINKRGGQDFGLPLRLKKIFEDREIHVVHTHNWGTCCEGILGAKLASVPVIIHQEHGTFIELVGSKKRRLLGQRIALSYVDQVIAISEDLKKKMVKALKISPQKIKVIINGVDIQKFSPSIERRQEKRAELGIGNNELIIGMVGRLEPVKNHKMFLSAMPELLKRFPTIRAILVGDGILKAELISIATELGIKDKILFLGVRNDIAELLSAMDLFVLPSLTEGICIAILEAMACELPVVVTAVGGNPEIVFHEKTGLLVSTKDVEGLVSAIETMLADKEKRKEYGKKAREMVEERFSLQRMVNEQESLYKFLLQKKKVIIEKGVPK